MQMISFENTLCSYDDDLLSSYTSSFLNALDTIAPVKVRMVKSRQRAQRAKRRVGQGTEKGVPESRTEMVKAPDSL